MSSFRAVFVAVTLATALVVGAFVLNSQRPEAVTAQPTAEMVRATGKCASCHREETGAVVHEYETSEHAARQINCLECHRPVEGQEEVEHRGFTIAATVTSKNCATCHAEEYREFLRSRHAAPAYAAVEGSAPFTQEQIDFAEQFHPGAVDRPANQLARLEGEAAITSGCASCHSVGRPNPDGSIGDCTQCHARHRASVELARRPRTCGQCHMGPDHAQLEIYQESKHGVLFDAREDEMDLSVDPEELTVAHMSAPTCSTCHMSGLEGEAMTHDVTERLSYWLFAPVSEKRPTWLQGQEAMKEMCGKCHGVEHTDRFYTEAEAVLEATNEKVREAESIMEGLRADGLLTEQPFDEPIEFVYFDYWHYYGRTAKHGAFMGGADFVQWHGNYELLAKLVEMREMARELRSAAGEHGDATTSAAAPGGPTGDGR